MFGIKWRYEKTDIAYTNKKKINLIFLFLADELQTEHPCGELYAGTRQLSESETYALTHYLREQRTTLFAFIAFKEGDVLVSVPSKICFINYGIDTTSEYY